MQCSILLLWMYTLPHPQLYVASCPDLTLRVFSKHFELLGTVNVTGTILRWREPALSVCRTQEFTHCSFSHSLSFNETTSELYAGGVGKHPCSIIALFQGPPTLQLMIACEYADCTWSKAGRWECLSLILHYLQHTYNFTFSKSHRSNAGPAAFFCRGY